MSAEIVSQLKEMIAKELDMYLGTDEIDEKASLFEGGIALDSMAIMDLILLVEERFGFVFDEAELDIEHFQTVSALADLIAAKLNGDGAAPGEKPAQDIA